jgi:multicomponent Na+:H+ antiporter subunit B
VIFLLHLLLVFMIIGAFITVEIKNMLSAVISIGAVGFAIEEKGESVFHNRTALIFVGIILVFAWFAFQSLAPFGEPLMRVSDYYLNNGLTMVGAANFVTSVILDFRAYDTFGEAMVLFVSISGAFAILRRWKREQHKDFLRIDREH